MPKTIGLTLLALTLAVGTSGAVASSAAAQSPPAATASDRTGRIAGQYIVTLKQAAAAFIGSEEFQHLYGTNVSTDEFVTLLYRNVLHRDPDAAELEELRSHVAADYERQTDVRYSAARLWVDAILDPAETRGVLIQSLEVATRVASDEPFRTGVYQV